MTFVVVRGSSLAPSCMSLRQKEWFNLFGGTSRLRYASMLEKRTSPFVHKAIFKELSRLFVHRWPLEQGLPSCWLAFGRANSNIWQHSSVSAVS